MGTHCPASRQTSCSYDELPVNEVYLVTPENQLLTDVEQLFIALLREAAVDEVRERYFRG